MYDPQRYRYGFDTHAVRKRTASEFLDSFAAECRRTPSASLTSWLAECPETDPAYPILRAELARRDATGLHEDDLSCFRDFRDDYAQLARDVEAEAVQEALDDHDDWIPSGGLL